MRWPDEASIGVVGATGAVGRETLRILAERGIPKERLAVFASERSRGGRVEYADAELELHPLSEDALAGLSLVFLMATAEAARRWAPIATEAGAVVIDNSSAFRLEPGVPLIVPEVNAHLLDARPRLIANPNCTTIILLTALQPLRAAFGVRAVEVCTYQAVSGAGLAAIEELQSQTRAALRGDPVAPAVFHEPCAFNLFSHDSPVDPESGLNAEERKVIDEARRIWNDPALAVTPTCIRVPVPRAHTLAITVTLDKPADERSIRAAFDGAEGVSIIDDRAANRFPTPLRASGRDPVLVGRLRPDPAEPQGPSSCHRRWCLMAAGDQLRKGAALNAVQIAERTGALRATAAS